MLACPNCSCAIFTGTCRSFSNEEWTWRNWRHDGKELYYLAPSGTTMMAAPITVTGATLAPGAPVALFPTRFIAGGADTTGLLREYDVTRDGRFLINTVLDEASAPITLIQNWSPDAKK